MGSPNVPALYYTGDEKRLGPAMRELNDRQRAVVCYLLDHGSDNFTEACKAAGYSKDGSYDALRITASRLRNTPAISAALVEEGKRRVNLYLPMALRTISSIAGDTAHKDALKAATTLAAMSGVSAVTVSKSEQHVIHHDSLMDDIRAGAAILGLDPEKLLRGRMKDVTPQPAQIEYDPATDISDLF